jgi:hypothetical protein
VKYKLIDIDDNDYDLNDGVLIPSTVRGSLSNSKDSYNFEQQILKRSFLPGSEVVGTVRIEAKKMSYTASFHTQDDADHDAYLNELLFWLKKAVIIKDVTNDKQAQVAILKLGIEYDKGSVKRSGEINITLQLLDGFWTSSTPVTVTQSVGAGTTSIALVNDGWLEAYPQITVAVPSYCNLLDLYIDETKEGLQLEDSTFGQITLREVAIDCQEGTLSITTFDRSQNIVDGTGYFPIPIGNSTFVIVTPVAADIVIAFNERHYI